MLHIAAMTTLNRLQDYKLIAFDMDSTLINIECIDELAAVAGKGREVAAITEAAMRGEIVDFRESLMRRLALLAGLPLRALEQVASERLRLNPGAEVLLAACRVAGLKTVLLSGGFTYFATHVQNLLGLDFTRANELEVLDGHLTGGLVMQEWGDVCDGQMKRQTLIECCAKWGIDAAQAIAVGDGANDIPMMQAAGLSVAYHAKPKVREQAHISIAEGGLDSLLDYLKP